MDAKTLSAATGMNLDEASRWAVPLTQAAQMYQINTPKRWAHFLAQIAHESASFRRLVESMNYSPEGLASTWPSRFAAATRPNALALELGRRHGEAAVPLERQKQIARTVYGGRMGNYLPDDGWNYRGRGAIQLTGRENYQAASNATGLDLVSHPEILERPEAASLVAAWFWQRNGLNEKADAGEVTQITRRINGGLVGIEDRRSRLALASAALMA